MVDGHFHILFFPCHLSYRHANPLICPALISAAFPRKFSSCLYCCLRLSWGLPLHTSHFPSRVRPSFEHSKCPFFLVLVCLSVSIQTRRPHWSGQRVLALHGCGVNSPQDPATAEMARGRALSCPRLCSSIASTVAASLINLAQNNHIRI